jgi:hypothetical protein
MCAELNIPADAWDHEPEGGIQAGAPSESGVFEDPRRRPVPPHDAEDDAEDDADAEDEPLEPDDVDELDAEDDAEPVPEPPRRRNRVEDEPEHASRSALDDYNALLGQLRKQLARANLPSRERIQISDAFSRALAHKERLERSREMLESRTIKDHPRWKELKAAIISALLEHPAAARDVEAAITRVLGADREDS